MREATRAKSNIRTVFSRDDNRSHMHGTQALDPALRSAYYSPSPFSSFSS